MNYTAKMPSDVQVLNTVLMFFLILMNDHVILDYFIIILFLFSLLSFFLKYTLSIDEDALLYKIHIFTIPIYKKVMQSNQIVSMKCKRVGWAKKCVVVQTNKGLNVRIINFYPMEIYKDLINYADQRDIPVLKSKDYLILERKR
ncbi:hypothetical protein [Gracilibacillus salinarum]|uniref:Uncharacterized protein n=1 Tax=Gracilibacillus salinarum TaxID=2932255 RepID=A0ABY4GL71_9BACI|nr:hypothetical protein [Gracilibacillus salinarum]UOQ84710.1 hypothetical protein MUN87_18935 [Gracilibacillus salinarum]